MMGLRKILSVIATSALLLNSIAPYSIAIAQEITPTPAPVDTSTPTPTDQPTIAPSDSPAATPEVSPAEIATPTPEVTSTPIDIVTPAPSDQPATTQAPERNPTTQGPPGSPAVSASATPTTAPIIPVEHGTLSETLLTGIDLSQVTGINGNVDGNSTISTNQSDYSPTSLVLISGSGFIANKYYTIEIVSTDQPPVDFTDQVKADSSGNISYSYQLDGTYRPNYTVYIKSGEVVIASVTFTDTNTSVSFEQCANNAGGTYSAGQCKWIGSILQQNNSTYFEGMSVPQRILYSGIESAGSHTVSFTYSYTKGGTHAYDFLTSVNQGNGSFAPGITDLNQCDSLSGPDTTTCTALTGLAPNYVSIPHDPFDSKDSAPAPGTGSSQTQKETWYEGMFGNRQFKIFSSNAFSSGTVSLSHSVAANADTGDSDVNVSLSFDLTGCSSNNPCSLLIYFGGHLAITGGDNTVGANWGTPLGSSNINGGPYHIKNLAFDGSGGSLDNQIAGADIILPGTIAINKTTVGGDSTFDYTSTGGSTVPSNFSITTSSNTGTQTFTNVLPGNYSVTETAPTSPWSFTSLQCTDPTQDTSVSSRTATIKLGAGETVSCTYTNTLQNGSVTVHKQVDTNGDGTFETTDIGANGLGFTWSLDSIGTNAMGSTVSGVTVGSHNVNENSVTGYHFVGWYLTSDTSKNCSNTTNNTLPASITVSNNQNTSVTLCNARDTGTLQVLKNVDLNGDGDYTDQGETGAADWKWQYNGGADHNTGDTAITVPTGDYALTETNKTDFHFVSLQCTGGTLNGSTVTVTTGANVVCTFSNAHDTAAIKVIKSLDPANDTGKFNLLVGANTVANAVGDGGNGQLTVLTGATYTVSETGSNTNLSNYDSSISCDNGQSGQGTSLSNVTVTKDTTTTCTITNTLKRGKIIVQKDMVGGTASFDFTGDVAGTISTNGGQLDSSNLLPGTYTATESAKTGWTLDSISCDDQNSTGDTGTRTATIKLDPGETVTCTFTNTKLPTLAVVKQLVPSNDPGKFNLRIDETTYASNVGDEGTTGAQIVSIGTHSVDETAGTGTNLSDYNTTYSENCLRGTIALSAGEDATCTITNTRKTGNVLIDKIVVGGNALASDWLFTVLNVAGQYHDGDQVTLNTGTYTISESTNVLGYTLTSVSGICSNMSTPSATLTVDEQGGTCTFTNTRDTGSVKVNKQIDSTGTDNYDQGNTEANILGFAWKLDSGSNNAMGTTVNNIETTVGDTTHSINEYNPGGYTFKGWYTNGSGYSCAEPEGTDLPFYINVAKDTLTEITLCNASDTGSIRVHKIIDADGNLETKGDQTDGGSWQFTVTGNGGDTNGATSETTGTNGLVTFGGLKTGDYNVKESTQNGYDLIDATCDSGNQDGNTVYGVGVAKDQTTQCTFYNTPNGSIHGYKWDDVNGNGINDDEQLLGDWTINLYKWNGEDSYDFLTSTVTDGTGWYWLTHLFPGQYKVCEVLQGGWAQTYPGGSGCHEFSLPNEGPVTINEVVAPEYDFGNQEQVLGLTVEKSNDKSGGASAGDTVTYTITVNNPGNQTIYGLDIKDTLPGGFTYVTGSTTGDSTNDPVVSGSVLTWTNITNLSAEGTFTIHYQAKIDGSESNGTYTNYASCGGQTRKEQAVTCDPDPVSSMVTIGSTPGFGGNLGQVLGISTELPATGNPTEVLLFALSAIGLGLFINGYQAKKGKKHAKN